MSAPAFAQTPGTGEVVVNEIAYDPPSPQASTNEWIEVVNRSAAAVDLAGLVIGDNAGGSQPVAGPLVLQPGEFAVFVRNETEFAAAYPGVAFTAVEGFPSLNNGGDTVTLTIGAMEIDAVPYLPSWGGSDASLERLDPDGPSADASNWATTTAPLAGTPGEQNTAFEVDTAPPTVAGVEAESATLVAVTFSEPVDIASAETEANYSIAPSIGQPASAEVMDDDAALVRLTLAEPLPGLGTYTLSVSDVQDRAGNTMEPADVPFAFGEGAVPQPGDLVLNEFLYDEPSTGNPGEFVELFNRTDETFDLADFTLSDSRGAPAPLSSASVFVEPDGYAVLVEDGELFAAVFPGVPFVEPATWNALNNGEDAIVLQYDGVTIDSLSYTAAVWDGEHVSLERRDPRGASSPANWAETTDARGGTPGAINSRFEPDVTGPQLAAVMVEASETTLLATFDEPVVAASVSVGAFSLSGGSVADAEVVAADQVRLTLGARLVSGTFTLSATDIEDGLGNTASSTLDFEFAGDETAPGISSATAVGDRFIRVVFTEPVRPESASDPTNYDLDGVTPASVLLRSVDSPNGTVNVADVGFQPDPPKREALTLRVQNLTDLAGNVRDVTTAVVFFGEPDSPTPGDLAINEIMFDPATGADGEYVEILNTTADAIFDLAPLVLDDAPTGTTAIASTTVVLGPGQALAIVADLATFRLTFPEAPALEAASFPGLGNSGDLVVLADAMGAVLDSVRYDPEWHRVELDDATGVSLERRVPALGPNDANNWSSSLDPLGGTPGAPNSIATDSGPAPSDAGLSFSPDPFDAGAGQGTTISYVLEVPASLVRVRIYDGAGRLVRELEAARLSGATGSLVWDGRDDRGERLRIGPYVVLLEAVDTEGGTTEAYKGVVVLARQL